MRCVASLLITAPKTWTRYEDECAYPTDGCEEKSRGMNPTAGNPGRLKLKRLGGPPVLQPRKWKLGMVAVLECV